MKKLYSFPFFTSPLFTFKEKVLGNGGRVRGCESKCHRSWKNGLNPLIPDLKWVAETRYVRDDDGEPVFMATLWGSNTPWHVDDELASIVAQTGAPAQDPSLETHFPDALHELHNLWVQRDEELMSAVLHRPAMPLRVLLPALAADWNIGADVSIESDPYRRRNSLGRRLARAACYEIDTDQQRGCPGRLAVTKLFPCTANGDEHPHSTDSLLLQIHL